MVKIHFNCVHNNVEGKLLSCNICTKSFQTKMKLNIHIKTIHGSQKHYKCESCNKLFSQAYNLKKHIEKVHEGNKD